MSNWFKVAVERKYIKSFKYESFENKKLIGVGGFGTVYSAYSKDIDQTIALKRLHHSSINDDDFVREIKNITKVDYNINIIRFLGITIDPTETYHMVLQYANNGDLRSYLRNHFSELDWPTKIKMAKEISSGINCLHNSNIIHRDLVSDFHLSCLEIGNLWNIQVLHIGVLFWELSSGVPPFKNVSSQVAIALNVISGKRKTPINGTPIDFMNLYCNAWDGDPNSRPNIAEICHKLNSIQLTPVYDCGQDISNLSKQCVNTNNNTGINDNYVHIQDLVLGAIDNGDIYYYDYNEFGDEEEIGDDVFGSVSKSEWKSGGLIVALRNLKIVTETRPKTFFMKELSSLNQFYDVTKDPSDGSYKMVFQFANNDNLREYYINILLPYDGRINFVLQYK
ncbi:kinase-like domain-containing protein [Gigaspora margarita]|uniref:Kinase-like domain-containing protein n=1 Tax=Gigaspora margarita TaxID=4874 RepID=A0A8H4A2D9_GIGMA|nr:kinase-like domain-containing protein [Gigaspora margarita]